MSQTSPLDPVIRRVSKSTLHNVDSLTEKIVIIDANEGEILQETPFWKIGRNLRYYLVSTRNTAECEGPVYQIKDFATKRAISINVTYEASCESGNEEMAAKALFEGNNPGATLNNLIERYVQDFVRSQKKDGVDVILNYFQLRENLQDYITQRIRKKVGLNLEVSLSLEHEDKLEPFSINSDNFPVRVMDYDEELNLKFETELQVDEENKINAILNYSQLSQLEDLIKKHIRRYLLENFTLHEYCYELNNHCDKLIEYLDQVLIKEGRKITFLSLESTSISWLPEEFKQIKHSVECDIKECPEQISVEHKLQLSLKDVGKYKANQIDGFEEWAKEKLSRITQTVLFEKTYVDILLAFDKNETQNEIKNEIKQKMEKEAETIGYTVKQLIVIPNLEPLKLKDGFEIEVKDESFETHDTRVKVKLNIAVTGKIGDLRSIEPYLNPQADILKAMEEVISRETRQIIHNVSPERFYMRFDRSDMENEITVEKELETGISEKLTEMFYVEEINIIPKMVETDLAKRFQKLQQGVHTLEVEAFPFRSGGRGQQVKFPVSFKVLSVHKERWYIFQSNSFQSPDEEINQIKEVFREVIKAKLNTVPRGYLAFDSYDKLKQIEKSIFEPSILEIINTFGLVIRIVTINRLPTMEEMAEQRKLAAHIESQSETDARAIDMTNEANLKELGQLLDKRSELIVEGVPDDDLVREQVDKRIKELTDKISSYSVEGSKPQLKQLTSDSSEDFSFDDYTKDIKEELRAITSTKQIEDQTKKIANQTDEENE